MKVIYKNMAIVGGLDNIMFIKVANIRDKRCVVAGLRNGRMLPLTDAVTKEECENPIRELNERCGNKLLNGFNMGPQDTFALRKNCIERMSLVGTPDAVLVSATIDSTRYYKPVKLAFLPPSGELVELQRRVQDEQRLLRDLADAQDSQND